MLLNVLLNGPRKPSFPGHTFKAMTPYCHFHLDNLQLENAFLAAGQRELVSPVHSIDTSSLLLDPQLQQINMVGFSVLCSCSLQHKDVDFLMFCCRVSCTETEALSDIKHPPIFGDNI